MYYNTPVPWPHMHFLLLHMQGWILRRVNIFMRQNHPGVGELYVVRRTEDCNCRPPWIFGSMAIEQIN